MSSIHLIEIVLSLQTPIMASVLRFGGLRLVNLTEQSLLNIRKYQPTLQQACFISSKTLRGSQKLVKSKPYDYQNKSYNVLNAIFDKTTHRMDENSKVKRRLVCRSTCFFFVTVAIKSISRSFWWKVHWQRVKLNSQKNWPKNWICCTCQRLTWT